MDEPKRHKTITVRHATPSRNAIAVIVAQLQDAAGRWMVPTITLSGSWQYILESSRFARDVGIALLVASYIFDEWMLDVKNE